MPRKSSLLNISIFILLLCVVFAGNTHAAATGPHEANGTYTSTGNSCEITFNSDNTLNVIGIIVECSDDGGENLGAW